VPDLTPGQAEVAGRLVAAVGARRFATFLLDGVTGSGKTETYAEAIAAAMEQGRQVLVLLPEIALTQSFLARFEARFGTAPVTWHSSLKSSERRRAWRAVARGEAQVVVGARSALFLPFASLGLIVVDEAHEISFKQDDGVRYNARDVAVMRGHFERIPVVLASATPALESLHMASTGRYERLVLPSRFGGAGLPDIKISTCASTRPSAATGWPRRWWKACATGWPRASRACCSSTGAAMPAHFVPHLRLSLPVPQLLGLAGGASPVAAAGLPPLRP
jgi:primosomal protein N' (replication factor Y)